MGWGYNYEDFELCRNFVRGRDVGVKRVGGILGLVFGNWMLG